MSCSLNFSEKILKSCKLEMPERKKYFRHFKPGLVGPAWFCEAVFRFKEGTCRTTTNSKVHTCCPNYLFLFDKIRDATNVDKMKWSVNFFIFCLRFNKEKVEYDFAQVQSLFLKLLCRSQFWEHILLIDFSC